MIRRARRPPAPDGRRARRGSWRVRCPVCDSFVSEWAAVCDRCGADVGDEPLIVTAGSAAATRRLFRTGDGVLGVSWCDAASGLHLSAVGQAQFVTLVANELWLSVARSSGG